MKLRRAVFLLHLTTGCVAGTVIFFLAGTGFLLAWQKPATAWAERGYATPPPPDTVPVPLDRLVAFAAMHEGREPSAVIVKSDPAAPIEVDFGSERRLFLNRFSGAAVGAGATRTRAFFGVVTALHRWFGAPLKDHAAARLAKGAFTLAFLVLIVTGLFLWIPRNWNWGRVKAGAILRFGLSGRARNWNLHNVLGIWAALPLGIIALTGAILAYGWMTALLYLATGSVPPRVSKTTQAQSRKHKTAVAPGESGVPLEQILENAGREGAGWQSIRIAPPNPADARISAEVDYADGGRPDRQVGMVFDRETGAVVRLTTFSSISLGQRLRAFTKYVHTGEAGGAAGETIAGLTALACCFLVWTGLAMVLQRVRQSGLLPGWEATSGRAADAPIEPELEKPGN